MTDDDTTKKKATKVGKAGKALRVTTTMRLLLEGQQRPEILQYFAEQGWGNERTADYYLAQASAAIEAETTIDRAKEFLLAKQRLENLYAVCMKRADFGNARLALADLSKLLSLNMPPAPQTLKLLGIDNAQLEDLIQALVGAGLEPSDVFDSMIKRAALAKKETDTER